MKDKDLIKKLQDKTYVRAFGLMSPDEQECFRSIGEDNCTSYTNIGWSSTQVLAFSHYITYAIKPGYQPEPEFVDLEIRRRDEDSFYGVYATVQNKLKLPYVFNHLHVLPSLPNFDCFWWDNGGATWNISTIHVAKKIAEDIKVFARFRT